MLIDFVNKLFILYIIYIKMPNISGFIQPKHVANVINIIPLHTEKVNFSCPPGTYYTSHPHKTDCRMFIECNSGEWIERVCRPGLAFDKNRKICDYKHKVQCDNWSTSNTTPQNHVMANDILCPLEAMGTYPHPFRIQLFIRCMNKTTNIEICPEGFIFNITKSSCLAINRKGQRNGKRNYPGLYKYLHQCPPSAQSNYLYPYDARKYVQCNRGDMKIMDCNHGHIFSISKRICWPIKDVPDINQSSPPEEEPRIRDSKIYCPIDLIGLYLHPFSEEKYLKCVYGRLYEKSCRPGFIFNAFTEMCEENLSRENSGSNYNEDVVIENDEGLTFLECPETLVGTFLHPLNCTRYIKCSSDGTEIGSCSKDKIFDFRLGKCGTANEINEYDHVKCLDNTKNMDSEDTHMLGVFCPETGLSKYPHPLSWHKYVRCDNGKLDVILCPRDKVFDIESSKCIDEKKALKPHS